jgi:signal transduction histidine kinase
LRSFIHTLEDRVRTRTRNLEAAVEVSRQVTTPATHPALIETMTSATRAAYDLYQVAIYEYSEDTKSLSYRAGSGERMPQNVADLQPIDLADTHNPLATAAREHSIETLQHPIDIYRLGLPFVPPQHGATLIVPLITHRDELLGVFVLVSEGSDDFGADEIRVFTLLANNLANSIRNAQLYVAQLEANERLKSVDTLKTQFLAGISHELQTPLNISLNFTEFVIEGIYGAVSDDQRDALEKAHASQRQLQAEINALLELSRLEADLITPELNDDVDLVYEFADIRHVVHSLLKGKPVVFIEDIDAVLPLVKADRRRLHHIWTNLLSNAAKFTDSGTITLSVKKQKNGVLLAVIDTGPGIATEDLLHIFDRFRQTALGKARGGTGLGLAITHAIVEAHGGHITVESTLGEGTAFYVFLPAADSNHASIAENRGRGEKWIIGNN